MKLNEISPAPGAKKQRTRVGRGHSAGQGKTCGRGHKGQHSRAGGFHKLGFEGGQMPLHRRLPKSGFTTEISRKTTEIRLLDLEKLSDDVIDLAALKTADLIRDDMLRVRIICKGEISKALRIKGLYVTAGARRAIEACGGTIEE